MVAYHANFLTVAPASHMGIGLCLSCSTFDLAPCKCHGRVGRGWPKTLGTCTHIRDPEEKPLASFFLKNKTKQNNGESDTTCWVPAMAETVEPKVGDGS